MHSRIEKSCASQFCILAGQLKSESPKEHERKSFQNPPGGVFSKNFRYSPEKSNESLLALRSYYPGTSIYWTAIGK